MQKGHIINPDDVPFLALLDKERERNYSLTTLIPCFF